MSRSCTAHIGWHNKECGVCTAHEQWEAQLAEKDTEIQALQAQVAEQWNALLWAHRLCNFHEDSLVCKALALTPTAALEKWKAMEKVCKAADALGAAMAEFPDYPSAWSEPVEGLDTALARLKGLDALEGKS